MINPTDRLLAQLNQTQLAQKDNSVYQVIKQLINRIKSLENSLGSPGSSTNTSIVTNILNQYLTSDDGGSEGSDGPPGVRGVDGAAGAAGATGAMGPPFPAFAFMDGTDGEDAVGIPGPVGSTGATGTTGATGPPSYGFLYDDGAAGEDGIGVPGANGSSGTSTQSWEGIIVTCCGDGNPINVLNTIQIGSTGLTPTQLTTSQGRVSYFKLLTAINVLTIRWYGIGATTAIYHIAIYRASDNVRISSDNNPNTTLNAWNSTSDSFSLAANTLYYAVISADTTGATAGMIGVGDNIQATSGSIRALPSSWPGSLDFDSSYVVSYGFGVVAVTLGVLPNPGLAPTAVAANLTGAPFVAIFLDSQ